VVRYILNQFFGLYIVQAMDTSDTITAELTPSAPNFIAFKMGLLCAGFAKLVTFGVPNRKDTTSLSKTGFFLNASNSLF
jgi:hypothetical protein